MSGSTYTINKCQKNVKSFVMYTVFNITYTIL